MVTTAEIPLRRTFVAADLVADGDEVRPVGETRFEGVLQKRDQRFRLKGRLQATLELSCARCAEPFAWPVEAEVDLTYLPQPSATAKPADPDLELSDEDLSTAYYHDHLLDLGEMVREQFYLALPMQPLHSDACRGLCPHCGTNLNTGTCACEVRWQDPRLAPLQALLRSPEDKR
jgi:uncharacterized protein